MLLQQRKSILDVIKQDVSELNGVLGTSEKQKLELHLDSIRQFEMRIAGTARAARSPAPSRPRPPTTCSSVAKKTLADMAHLDLIVNAFACDITRLGGGPVGQQPHLAVRHAHRPARRAAHGHHPRAASAPRRSRSRTGWPASSPRVVKKLQSIPEPDGSGTLFDNTLVVWTRDFGDANAHNSRNMKFVLAQGNGGYLKTDPNGRYIKGVAGNNRQERILLNLAEAMGVTDFAGFGDMAPTSSRTRCRCASCARNR